MDKSERELERELQNTQDEIRRELRRHRADQLRKKWNGSFLPREPLTQSMSALLGGPGSLLAANNIQDDLCFPEIVEIVLNANPNALGWVLSDVNARVGFLEGLAEHREVMHTSVNHWYNPPKRRGRKRSQTESGQDRNGEMFRRVCRDGEDPLLVSEDFAIRPGTLRQHLRRTRKQLMGLLRIEDLLSPAHISLAAFFTKHVGSADIGCGLQVDDLSWLMNHLRAENNKLPARQLQKQQP